MAAPKFDRVAFMAYVMAGHSCREAARKFGISNSVAHRLARKAGYDAAAAYAERQALHVSPRAKTNTERGAGASVPAWASAAGLTDDFRDFARDFGEMAAARHCRQLLAERRRLEALDARLGRTA